MAFTFDKYWKQLPDAPKPTGHWRDRLPFAKDYEGRGWHKNESIGRAEYWRGEYCIAWHDYGSALRAWNHGYWHLVLF